MKVLTIICATLLSQPALAQEAAQDLAVDPASVEACYDGTPIGTVYPDCLGAAAGVCQDQPGGSTTIGISDCIQSETVVWDQLLNTAYQDLRADLGGRAQGTHLTTALRDAQRAWLAFRDAECALRYDIWADGTIRSIVGANCLLTQTASRALDLRDMGAL